MRNDFETGYLMHWGLSKGAKKKDHKYYERIELANGRYRYFYSKAEWDAYQKVNKKDKKSDKDSIADIIKKFGNTTVDKANKLIEKGKKKVDSLISKIKSKRIDKKTKDLKTDAAREEAKERRKQNAKDYAKNVERQRRLEKQRKVWTEREEKAAREKRQSERIEKNAFNLFSKDAKDSKKEDQSQHPDLRIKKTVATKDQDMAAVNRDRKLADERYERLYKEFKAAEKAHDWDKCNSLVDAINASSERFNAANYNCASCSIAYDMRRRGYDVTAPKQIKQGNEYGGFSTDRILEAYKPRNESAYKKGDYYAAYGTNYKNADKNGDGLVSPVDSRYKAFDTKQVNEIKREILENNPEGSYGILNEFWYTGGGHSVVWSIENGDVIIRDAQVNEVRTFEEDLTTAISCNWTRTDDLELDHEAYEYANAERVINAEVAKEKDPRSRGRKG